MKSSAIHDAHRRILIVDDHPLVRHGFRELLEREPNVEVCGEAETVQEALRLASVHEPDLVIADISLKEGNGIDLVKRLKALHPTVRVLVASMHDEALYAERVLRAGAMGYVCKHQAVEKILDSVRVVLEGGVYLSPEMTARLLKSHPLRAACEGRGSIAQLTDRELEVFDAIGRGRSTRVIAEELKLSAKTIETHRENIKRKLSLNNATELIQRACEWALGES